MYIYVLSHQFGSDQHTLSHSHSHIHYSTHVHTHTCSTHVHTHTRTHTPTHPHTHTHSHTWFSVSGLQLLEMSSLQISRLPFLAAWCSTVQPSWGGERAASNSTQAYSHTLVYSIANMFRIIRPDPRLPSLYYTKQDNRVGMTW